MNARKSKAARKACLEVLEKNGDRIPAGYKKTHWGQVVNPRRALYQRIKKGL